VRAASSVLGLAMGVVVARLYGPDGSGAFYLALSSLMYATSIARIGMDQVLLRRSAQSSNEDYSWYGLYTASVVIGSGISVVICFLFLGSNIFFNFWGPTGSESFILIFGVLPSTLLWVNSGMVQGKGHVHHAVFLQAICIPLLALPLILLSNSVSGAIWSYFAAICVSSIISFIVVLRRFGRRVFLAKPTARGDFLRSSLNLGVASLMNIAQNWLPITLAALFFSTHEVGLLSAAMRISAVGAMVLTALNSYSAPLFAKLYSNGDFKVLQSRIDDVSALGFFLGLPLVGLLFLFPNWVISIFGQEFREAAHVLTILALGQLVIFATGAGSVLLAMTKHDAELMQATVASVGVLSVLSIAGMYITGSYTSVAWASTVSVAVQNVIICIVAKRKIGVSAWFSPIRLLRRSQPV